MSDGIQQQRAVVHQHTKGDGSWWLDDARGIAIARVCAGCVDAKRREYRPEVFTDANYVTNEPVEEEE